MDLDLFLLPCVQLHEEGMAKSHLRRQWGRYLGTQTMHTEGANEHGMTICRLFSLAMISLGSNVFCLLAPLVFGAWAFTKCMK